MAHRAAGQPAGCHRARFHRSGWGGGGRPGWGGGGWHRRQRRVRVPRRHRRPGGGGGLGHRPLGHRSAHLGGARGPPGARPGDGPGHRRGAGPGDRRPVRPLHALPPADGAHLERGPRRRRQRWPARRRPGLAARGAARRAGAPRRPHRRAASAPGHRTGGRRCRAGRRARPGGGVRPGVAALAPPRAPRRAVGAQGGPRLRARRVGPPVAVRRRGPRRPRPVRTARPPRRRDGAGRRRQPPRHRLGPGVAGEANLLLVDAALNAGAGLPAPPPVPELPAEPSLLERLQHGIRADEAPPVGVAEGQADPRPLFNPSSDASVRWHRAYGPARQVEVLRATRSSTCSRRTAPTASPASRRATSPCCAPTRAGSPR